MSTLDLYEEWRQKVEQAGIAKGIDLGRKEAEDRIEAGVERAVKQCLLETYETRFSAIPADLQAAIDAMHDEPTLHAWFKLALTRSADEIGAAIRASRSS